MDPPGSERESRTDRLFGLSQTGTPPVEKQTNCSVWWCGAVNPGQPADIRWSLEPARDILRVVKELIQDDGRDEG
ncbi:hypothetical protein [Streptomyces sp. NPDC008150]|uniref:hypothetical protein n=1 Tax=Streptomyces sp. NPDC008150 TaxID=3364816 RepID=UPI0036E881D8